MGKARKNLGLGLTCIAFIFLFNPVVGIIDILPDFIGYLLLCVGLSQIADMNDHFGEALRYFKRMILVSSVQIFLFFIFFGMVTGKEQPTAMLLFAFVFAAVDIIFLSHAYHQLFEGILYLSSRMEGTAAFAKRQSDIKRYEEKCQREEKRVGKENERRAARNLPLLRVRSFKEPKTATARIASYTTFFIVLKAILTVLPEFSSLTITSMDETKQYVFVYDFIGLYRQVCILALLPFAIVWLVKIIRFIRSIMADMPFMEHLMDKYVTEIQPKTHLFIQRAIKLAFTFLSVALIFNIDFYVDDYSILPDFICPIILIFALLLLRKFVKIPPLTYGLCGIYTISSVATYVLSAIFYSNYTLSLTKIRVEAYQAFQTLQIVKCVDSVLFALMILSLFPVLLSVIKSYTGFSPVSGNNVQMEDKIRYVHTLLTKKAYLAMVLGILCGIAGICYILFVKIATFMWLIDFVVCLTFSVYTIMFLNHVTEEVEYKYLLT